RSIELAGVNKATSRGNAFRLSDSKRCSRLRRAAATAALPYAFSKPVQEAEWLATSTLLVKRRNLSRLWKSPRIATSLRKREVVPRSSSPTAGSTSSPFNAWWQNDRGTSRL